MTLTARLLAVPLLVGSLSGALAAQETLVWTQKASGGFVTLAYGPLDPRKTPVFMLSCLNGAGIAVLDVSPGASGEAGTEMTIALVNADLTASVEAEIIHDEASGAKLVEASDIDVKPILDVLKGSGPVTMTVGDATAELSDQDRSRAVEEFTKQCELT
jgi:hypothetical protein